MDVPCEKMSAIGAIRTVCVLVTVALGLALGALSPAGAGDYSFTTIAVPGASSTTARGINDAGDIVGQYSVLGDTSIHSFLFAKGRFTTIDYPGAYVTVAHGINKAGQIVGAFNTPGGTKHRGFRRDPDGSFTVIDVPDSTYTDARGINTSGEIAGWFTDTVAYHGFLLSGGHYTPIDVAGAASMEIHAINDSGQMVGYVNDGMNGHGVLVSGGTDTPIDAPGAGSFTSANGINNAGEIAGTFQTAAGALHGFVRDTSGVFETIDPPGSLSTSVFGINNAGQIVGGFSDTGTQNGFLGTSTDLELIIEPGARYDDWLPEGSFFEDLPGGPQLSVRAVLQHKGGGPPSVEATTMTFRLTSVSHEPGIAMNFPRNPRDPAGPDLKFAPAPSGIIADDGLSMELVPGAYTEAIARIASFDFGAYGVLEVTATTENGPVTGHLEGQEDKTQLLIPKRAENSFIADKWKEDYGAAADGDTADLDDEPAGSGKTGDYLTAYEEYRGVFEVEHPTLGDFRYVRTDPRKKDVFIRDVGGIGLHYFTTENLGTPVHVLFPELWDADRVVNYNHATAHVNDQRGIKVEDGGETDDGSWGHTIVVAPPFIPNRIVKSVVFEKTINAAYAELRADVLATSTALPYKLKPGSSLYREEGERGVPGAVGGAVLIGDEVVIYKTSQPTPAGPVFNVPSRMGEMHRSGTAISAFANPRDVARKVLAHEAGHAVGLKHLGTESGPCGGFGKTIMSIPLCAGSVNEEGYWTVFVGDQDARAGRFEVVE